MKKTLTNKRASVVKPDIVNELNVKAVTNNLKVDRGGIGNINQDQILEYGTNNLYPNEVYQAIRLSPTAKGCVELRTEFLFGQGIEGGDDLIVNREGHTLNEIYYKSCETFAWLNSHVEHFNFNLIGQISEITNIDTRLVRKKKDLMKARIDNYGALRGGFFSGNKIEIYLYDPEKLSQQIEKDGGFDKFKGNIYYWTVNNDIYTIATGDASLPSAQFENKIQIHNFSNINNNFSASGVFKKPRMTGQGNDIETTKDEIGKLHGAENAGSIIVVEMPVNMDGEMSKLNLFEPFTPTNVDKMYVEQARNAKDNIFREFRIPEILLGVSPSGMFNQASYNDAFNYYNGATQKDRSRMLSSFKKFWGNTVFAEELPELNLTPLEMKTESQTQKESDGQETDND